MPLALNPITLILFILSMAAVAVFSPGPAPTIPLVLFVWLIFGMFVENGSYAEYWNFAVKWKAQLLESTEYRLIEESWKDANGTDRVNLVRQKRIRIPLGFGVWFTDSYFEADVWNDSLSGDRVVSTLDINTAVKNLERTRQEDQQKIHELNKQIGKRQRKVIEL